MSSFVSAVISNQDEIKFNFVDLKKLPSGPTGPTGSTVLGVGGTGSGNDIVVSAVPLSTNNSRIVTSILPIGVYVQKLKFSYNGTDVSGIPTSVDVVAWTVDHPTGATVGDIRLFDITNVQTLAEITGFSNLNQQNIVNLPLINPFPSGQAFLEVQLRKTGPPIITPGTGSLVFESITISTS